MKKLALLAGLSMSLFLFSCSESEVEQVECFKPIYGEVSDLQHYVKSTTPHELKQAGKIYVKGSLLLINEVLKGVHVYDNSDPAHPEAIKFIQIPGNLDIAMKGNFLYADYLGGLLTIDISDLDHIAITDFNASYKPLENGQTAPPSALLTEISDEKIYYQCPKTELGMVIGWEREVLPKPSCYIENNRL